MISRIGFIQGLNKSNFMEEKGVMKISSLIRLVCRLSLVSASGIASAVSVALVSLVAVIALAGCGSGSSDSALQVGSITFSDANGNAQKAPTTLTAGQGNYVEVTLTNDSHLLGADWSVACGSALPPGTPLPPGQTQDQSCGTFMPTHTMSGPIPSFATSATGYIAYYTAPASVPKAGVVTLYASATGDHTKYSSVTLTIDALPLSLEFAPPAPSSLSAGASTKLTAVVSNDSSGAGVTWNVVCGSSECGSFSAQKTASGAPTTYTAPSNLPPGNTVVITATSVADSTKSTSATITITPAGVAANPAESGDNATESLELYRAEDMQGHGH